MPRYICDRRIYLQVPFEEKDLAKQNGAKFDGIAKQWYAPAGTDIRKFADWYKE